LVHRKDISKLVTQKKSALKPKGNKMRRNFLKAVACASLLALTGLAQAASVTLTPGSAQTTVLQDPAGSGRTVTLSLPGGGTSHFEFSNGTGTVGGLPADPMDVNGFVGVANVFNSKVTSQGASIVNEKSINDSTGTPGRVFISVDANIASAKFDNTTGVIASLSSNTSFTITNPSLKGLSSGGTTTFKNIKVDLASKTVYADLVMTYNVVNSATRVTTPTTSTLANVAVWNFDKVQGPATIPVAALVTGNTAQIKALGYEVLPNGHNGLDYSATIKVSNLRVTNAGLTALSQGFGANANPTGKMALASVNGETDGWGSIILTNRLSTTLPQCSF
jgi:hypothetical protein